jgi:hypothetical protein
MTTVVAATTANRRRNWCEAKAFVAIGADGATPFGRAPRR